MASTANIRKIGDVVIVELSGRIALGDGSGVVRDTVNNLLRQNQTKIILNLGDVSYIDSAGLGELIGAYAKLTKEGGQVKLLNVQKKVDDLLQLTKLYTVFEAFTSETAAVQSFGQKSAMA